MNKYILDDEGNPVLELDLLSFGRWFESADRSVASDVIDDAKVSTVFLGTDHAYGDGLPILFETMIFGGKYDQYQERYCNRKDAIAGHNRAMILLRGSKTQGEMNAER